MTEIAIFQYPPELFQLLVDTIPLLTKSKKDLLLFFRGAGMTPSMMAEVEDQLAADRNALHKFEIARRLLTVLNAEGDRALLIRRQLLRRVVEFEDFSRCYENKAMEARGLVAQVQHIVNVKDSFTKMSQARDHEAQAAKTAREQQQQAEVAQRKAHRERVSAAKAKLFALFTQADPHRRGKELEGALNALFAAYGVLVAEDFRRKGGGDSGVMEQIDGVVEIDNQLYLVEMKWWATNLGHQELAPHVSRLMMRAGVSGIFISSSDYTPSALELADGVLQQRVLILCTLREIVSLLEREGDLVEFIRAKVRAAKLNRMAFKEISA